MIYFQAAVFVDSAIARQSDQRLSYRRARDTDVRTNPMTSIEAETTELVELVALGKATAARLTMAARTMDVRYENCNRM